MKRKKCVVCKEMKMCYTLEVVKSKEYGVCKECHIIGFIRNQERMIKDIEHTIRTLSFYKYTIKRMAKNLKRAHKAGLPAKEGA